MDAGMIALLPQDPGVLALDKESATPPTQIHLTMVYLGDDVTGWDPTRTQLLQEATRTAARTIGPPVQARVMGHATFNPDGGPDGDRDPCGVYLVGDSDRLTPTRDHLSTVCGNLLGPDYPTQHEPFLPHMTAGFGMGAGDLTYTGPVVFDRLALVLAGHWTVVPLEPPIVGEAIAPYARAAYAQGWAASGGPMTDRVKAGSVAAVEHAVQAAHDPRILEVTLRLGHLEGVWARVYEQRHTLINTHTRVVRDLWRKSVHLLDLRAAVTGFRKSMDLGEAVDPQNTEHRRLVANTVAGTVAQSIAGDSASPPDREAIITALAGGMAAAHAQGYASSATVTGDGAGTGVPTDRVAADHQPPSGMYWGAAAGWVGKMVTGAATDVGGRLSRLAGENASYEDMLTGIRDVVDGDTVPAVDAYTDQALSAAFTDGTVAFLTQVGTQSVNFTTAGINTCPVCQGLEDRNPWNLGEVPSPPIHPHCMCTLTPAGTPSGLVGALSKYLTPV